jgi:predicted extracellular nuclease
MDTIIILYSGMVHTPTPVSFPYDSMGEREHYEGMHVIYPQTLTTVNTSDMTRRGRVTLSALGIVEQPTNYIDPNDNPASGTTDTGKANVAAVDAAYDAAGLNWAYLDDGSWDDWNDPIAYVNTTHRIGSTVDSLTGCLYYASGAYRLMPTETPNFVAGARPAAPSGPWGGDVRFASFNVNTFFNGDGMGGGWSSWWGADDASEYAKQKDKLVQAIIGLDAAVIGLTEVENDGDGSGSAIQDLVKSINAAIGTADTFRIIPHHNPGSENRRVSMIYRLSKVHPQSQQYSDVNTDHFYPPLGIVFSEPFSGKRFWVIMNHYRWRSCGGGVQPPNDNQDDGQACYNHHRREQTSALLDWLPDLTAAEGDTDFIIMGDFNAYSQEDPIDRFRSEGFTNLTDGAFSIVSGGYAGAMDHILASSGLASTLSSSGSWQVNSHEPAFLDYNEERNPPSLYVADAHRSSDRDPVWANLMLGVPSGIKNQVVGSLLVHPNPFNGQVTLALPAGQTVEIRITDVMGRMVKLATDVNADRFTWKTSAQGVFIYTVTDEDGSIYRGTIVSQ